ncbi:5-carboxymethyl-2-hydroxymuconate Delta-isomerase [Fulvivirgaceae bacterium BMA10]|uniref:5-carboxymethyl-2-hydroxymuconate Delta-isomerase n=1 Tax=Splendidivirga corallicola TaxID=3051826 RepID=A0ABT8KHQ0_9BACT|nr:5-carboxymethyl-2-hydroxymuconate Delta-isomerase [Fulvivirgaceae bacterium BMA10]
MPHFIIDCSENILNQQLPEKIMQQVYDTADATGLFAKGDIKVRINPFKYFTVGNNQADFIHIIAYIMGGRTTDQKKNLATEVVKKLKTIFPEVPVISIDVKDIDKNTYCNRTMV